MGSPVDLIDLFVEGTDFYSGSTRHKGKLKDGWCDFRKLGKQQAEKHFDRSCELGRIWYLTAQVSTRELPYFEEHERQKMWLSVQGSDVTRIVVDDKCRPVGQRGVLDSAGEFRYKTEEAAISALGGTGLAPNAMVISADHEPKTPLLTFLDKTYHSRGHLVLVPPDVSPDSEMQASGFRRVARFSHDELFAARLGADSLWNEYMKSRGRRHKAADWSSVVLSERSPELKVRLNNNGPYRDRERWMKWAHGPENLERVKEKVTISLRQFLSKDRPLSQDHNCIEFIARYLIKEVADDVSKERYGPDPDRSSIRTGRDLIAQAARVYPKIEICEEAERQIRAMTGNEKHFGWVLDAFLSANREMLAWNGGLFPHSRLPGPATPESESVMRSPRLEKMRRFRTRNGEELLFEHHMKCMGEGLRIHYRLDPARRLFMIGYIGRHLPLC